VTCLRPAPWSARLAIAAMLMVPARARAAEVGPEGKAAPVTDDHRPWRASVDGAFAFGPSSSLITPGSVGATGALTGRLRLRVSSSYSLAVTGGLFGTRSPHEYPLGTLGWIGDVGFELRRSHYLDVGPTNWHTIEAYLSIPAGISTVHMDQSPHRALVEHVESHAQPYVGLAGGIQFAARHIGFFGEVRYAYHPIRYTDSIVAADGSQMPLVQSVDSAGHQVMFMFGGALGLLDEDLFSGL